MYFISLRKHHWVRFYKGKVTRSELVRQIKDLFPCSLYHLTSEPRESKTWCPNPSHLDGETAIYNTCDQQSHNTSFDYIMGLAAI